MPDNHLKPADDIHALTGIDLAGLLPPEAKQPDATLEASYVFAAAARNALNISKQHTLDAQGDAIDTTRAKLEQLADGLQKK
ncbi:hypothetical protein FRC03_002367 [Tulasnella sp. 419]|nr:hypothetical protein FRC02_010447 [Tulasnella sp. 418]KAG8969506.1 hypothetical protein FRC03_002367 [Tulasnella sp. 419]